MSSLHPLPPAGSFACSSYAPRPSLGRGGAHWRAAPGPAEGWMTLTKQPREPRFVGCLASRGLCRTSPCCARPPAPTTRLLARATATDHRVGNVDVAGASSKSVRQRPRGHVPIDARVARSSHDAPPCSTSAQPAKAAGRESPSAVAPPGPRLRRDAQPPSGRSTSPPRAATLASSHPAQPLATPLRVRVVTHATTSRSRCTS